MSGWLAGLLDSIGIVPAAPGLLDAPVGTSTMQRLTNPSPTVSPLASAMLNSSDQKIGRFWNAATGRAKQHYTGADMAQLTAAGNEGLDAALGWTGMTTPIRAYHGSPHTFDRFDLSKIGTGEGKQAEGYGLYFAQSPKTAEKYESVLSNRISPTHRGAVYEVNINANPADLIDWNKPISAQNARMKEWLKSRGFQPDGVHAERSPMEILTMERDLLGPQGLSQSLNEAGVPGIQYLDAGSRAAGDGSRNYVMFRDDIIDILKRYGLLGMLGGGAAVGAEQ